MFVKKIMPEFCDSPHSFKRNSTREVTIGNKISDGNQPILIQSMTTTETMDTERTVQRPNRMIDAGCAMVRITGKRKKEAKKLRDIKNDKM